MRTTKHKAQKRDPRKETLALLKILELGDRQIAAGKVYPVAEVFQRLKAKKARKPSSVR